MITQRGLKSVALVDNSLRAFVQKVLADQREVVIQHFEGITQSVVFTEDI